MNFGMRTWGADRSLQFDTDSSTYQVVMSEIVSFDKQGRLTKEFPAPGCSPANTVALVLPIAFSSAVSTANLQLEAEVGDGIIYVRNFIKGFAGDKLSNATMRLLVMRWR